MNLSIYLAVYYLSIIYPFIHPSIHLSLLPVKFKASISVFSFNHWQLVEDHIPDNQGPSAASGILDSLKQTDGNIYNMKSRNAQNCPFYTFLQVELF
jgi:hypothetical protein